MFILSHVGHALFSWLEKQELSYWRSRMHVGKGVDIKKGLRVSKPGNIRIGDYVSLGANVVLQAHDSITIGDYTLIAAGAIVVTGGHPLDKTEMEMRTVVHSPVHIGKSCWLGAGVIVLPGVSIGDAAVVGAGSVVTRDLPAGMICVGVPAVPIKARPNNETPHTDQRSESCQLSPEDRRLPGHSTASGY